jgi:hypothetical protein
MRPCACPARWRGAISAHARAPLLSARVVVTVNMSDFDPADTWAAMHQMADALPRDVPLDVSARFDRALAVAISVGARFSRAGLASPVT